MTNGKNNPTFKDLYELVDSRANSIDQKIQHLSQRFDTLADERLSALETKFNELKANQSIANFKVLIVWGIIVAAGSAVLNALIRKLVS